jgi:SAM-dependent methyltransferase
MNKINETNRIKNCLINDGTVTKILDFGQHAYADTFISEDQINLSEPVFPLELYLNPQTGQIQLGYASHAEDRYNLYSYSYTSSNSKTARDHWDEYANTMQDLYPRGGLIVEIGSNDGYLLKQFKNDFTEVLGVDSSKAMCDIAKENGIETENGLFNRMLGARIRAKRGPASLVIANNVFNHSNDPVDFARGVATLLDKDGIFVFELPYWASMIESGRFTDMVYHEHISYFTIKSASYMLKKAGLEIVDYSVVNYHGGSIRVIAKLFSGSAANAKVLNAINCETSAGLFDVDFYKTLQTKFETQKKQWLADFYKLLNEDPTAVVIGVGAAAKANTWLTWHGLNKTVINCITDASPHKQGKYTPLSRIPICGDEEFAKYDNPYALILSWNISEPLKAALLKINPNTRFISQ